MRIKSVLIDENLLWDVLLEKYSAMESMEFVWEQILLRNIRGCVTDIAIEDIWRKTFLMNQDQERTEQLVSKLLKVLECRLVGQMIVREACSLNLRFSAAIQVLCGLDWNVDGILTSTPLDFCHAELENISIFTPGWLVVNHLENSFGDKSKYPATDTEVSQNSFGDVVLVPSGNLSGTSAWRLEQLTVCCGDKESKATVVIQTPTAGILQETATGNGPIDAAYKAIKRSLDKCGVPNHRLVYTATQATTADSAVSVTILLQVGDSLFPGRGFHTDTVRAYVYAYIDAIDYMLCCSVK
ncbi:MAG: hypothetical protein F6K04_17340 [Leptolyngbya sp. SIO4C5]|nr:hypothetical protein [Leptolyngbya sp. SIO4C5]